MSSNTSELTRPSGLPKSAPEPSGLQSPNPQIQSPATKKKLSYMEAREYSTIEQRISDAEEVLAQKKAAAEDPSIAMESARLLAAHAELDAAQNVVDELFARWAELEAKMS